MKHKELKACISFLHEVHNRNDLKPEQKQAVEKAIKALRSLRRKSHPSKKDAFECVRQVTEQLIKAFVR